MRILALGLAALLALALPAKAEDARPQIANAAGPIPIDAALAWIRDNSDYKITTGPARIALMSPKAIADYAANRGFRSGNIVAMFDCASETMFLDEGANFAGNWNAGVLIHELVHHAQCVDQRPRNLCALEGEAYRLQVKFLNQRLPAGREDLGPRNTAWGEKVTAEMCSRY